MDGPYNKLSPQTSERRAALVVGHPGHELLVHGWLERVRPRVFVFTDGSAAANQSRLDSTSRILDRTGAERGSIYGRFTDRTGYSAILNHDFDYFIALAGELAEALVTERIDYVAGDASEGYNPMHDVCRSVINAAVELAGRTSGRRIANYEFSLIGQPIVPPEKLRGGEIRLQLEDDEFSRKIAAAKEYGELAGEVSAALSRTSVDAFRVECLSPVADGCGDNRRWGEGPPFYEQHGEQQVAAGLYRRVLRYDEHIAPLNEALRRYAESDVWRFLAEPLRTRVLP